MEYKWIINAMDSKLHEGDLEDVVIGLNKKYEDVLMVCPEMQVR